MSDESLVLVLYSGGTIGMIKPDEQSGFEPYPSFLTETLRSQSRFHDPVGDSIFSWTDTADRFKAWSDVYTRSPSGESTPHHAASTKPRPALLGEVSRRLSKDRPGQLHHDSGVTIAANGKATSHAQPAGPPFGHSVIVRSSSPRGVSTHHALSSKPSIDGQMLELELPTLITPKANGRRVRYVVLEYEPLLDSSDMDIPDWIRIASDIQANYRTGFDGFLVLHGTDTMAYTSSALSFLLENLGKTVVVTGAQVPLSQLRNDAIENMLGALLLAGNFTIPEVTLYFAGRLYRGNRTTKSSNSALAAFSSPNMPPLASVGISIDVDWPLIERPRAPRPFSAHRRMCADVTVLRLFPGLGSSAVRAALAPPLAGAVLETYGAGNAPGRPDLLNALREAADRGVVIVNITQCAQGAVAPLYGAGRRLEAAGVVSGADMTPECALAKLSYLLAKEDLSRDDVRHLMTRPLRGELTAPRADAPSAESELSTGDAKMGSLVAHILGRTPQAPRLADDKSTDLKAASASVAPPTGLSPADMAFAQAAILPYLILRAASVNDISALEWHLSALSAQEASPEHGHSAEMQAPIDRAFALHAAAARGHAVCVAQLLAAGAGAHVRDASGTTALFHAARGGHGAAVRALRVAGAHLAGGEADVARALLSVAGSMGLSDEEGAARVDVWREAGLEV